MLVGGRGFAWINDSNNKTLKTFCILYSESDCSWAISNLYYLLLVSIIFFLVPMWFTSTPADPLIYEEENIFLCSSSTYLNQGCVFISPTRFLFLCFSFPTFRFVFPVSVGRCLSSFWAEPRAFNAVLYPPGWWKKFHHAYYRKRRFTQSASTVSCTCIFFFLFFLFYPFSMDLNFEAYFNFHF